MLLNWIRIVSALIAGIYQSLGDIPLLKLLLNKTYFKNLPKWIHKLSYVTVTKPIEAW